MPDLVAVEVLAIGRGTAVGDEVAAHVPEVLWIDHDAVGRDVAGLVARLDDVLGLDRPHQRHAVILREDADEILAVATTAVEQLLLNPLPGVDPAEFIEPFLNGLQQGLRAVGPFLLGPGNHALADDVGGQRLQGAIGQRRHLAQQTRGSTQAGVLDPRPPERPVIAAAAILGRADGQQQIPIGTTHPVEHVRIAGQPLPRLVGLEDFFLPGADHLVGTQFVPALDESQLLLCAVQCRVQCETWFTVAVGRCHVLPLGGRGRVYQLCGPGFHDPDWARWCVVITAVDMDSRSRLMAGWTQPVAGKCFF